MGRPRNPFPSGGNRSSSLKGARAPAFKPVPARSATPSARGTPKSTNSYRAATGAQAHQWGHSSWSRPAKMASRGGCQETRGQRDNPKWHQWRENRITASGAHKIANSQFVTGKSSEVPQSYVNSVVGRSSDVRTPAMSWGINNEKKAVQEYQLSKSKRSRGGVTVDDCGTFIHPKKTWLAASPDGIVKNSSTGKTLGLLEVKCPYKHKDHTIREACKDDNFCLTPVGKSYTLKKDHSYYTQVQAQMASTGVKKTDFVVHTRKETTITPVKFDAKFWKATEPKLEKFYTEAVIPYLEKGSNPV